MAIFASGPPNLKGIKYFDLLLCTVILSPNPTFMPSLSEIGNVSSSLLGSDWFLVDTLFIVLKLNSEVTVTAPFTFVLLLYVESHGWIFVCG